ncbi:MAG TPA: chloride channel protein [Bacteroidota bacterium]|nr:chloride channel protein [Bacteroidota bacterium]
MKYIVARIRGAYAPAIDRLKRLSNYRHTDYGLILSSTILGITVGVAIAVFHLVVLYAEGLFNNFFLAANTYPILRYLFLPFIVAVGGLIVGILNATIFRGVKDEGLNSVVESVGPNGVLLHRRSSLKAILTAAFSIGSGGGAGREAPTILLGASVGSTLGRLLRLRSDQLRILGAAGAAAAISGIFNAPLGGIVFAVETIVGEVSVAAFVPLVISSVMATATSRLFLGDSPILVAPPSQLLQARDYFLLAIAGMLSGGIALYYLKTYHWCFRKTEQLVGRFPTFLRPAIGGLGQGVLVAFLPTMMETTYDPINLAIAGSGTLLIAAVSVLVKPFSTAITLGSGGAGGTLAPALKIGALFGLAFGFLLALIIPSTSPGLYALVSTAAVLAGCYRIPLTGAILVFEICRNYNLILPLMFASIFAAFVVQRSGIQTFNPLDRPHAPHEE